MGRPCGSGIRKQRYESGKLLSGILIGLPEAAWICLCIPGKNTGSLILTGAGEFITGSRCVKPTGFWSRSAGCPGPRRWMPPEGGPAEILFLLPLEEEKVCSQGISLNVANDLIEIILRLHGKRLVASLIAADHTPSNRLRRPTPRSRTCRTIPPGHIAMILAFTKVTQNGQSCQIWCLSHFRPVDDPREAGNLPLICCRNVVKLPQPAIPLDSARFPA